MIYVDRRNVHMNRLIELPEFPSIFLPICNIIIKYKILINKFID